ncbi:hypothetical protein [Streptomyces sp. NPDC090022]|uniref:hypothetical protein n=1 Tax=Streptomyces sp. NPDC090022 TaxID=3365920 RepID=UPI003813902B
MRRRLNMPSDRRIGKSLTVLGLPVSLAGAAFYVLPGPGFPLLVIGLSFLATGLAMIASGPRRG